MDIEKLENLKRKAKVKSLADSFSTPLLFVALTCSHGFQAEDAHEPTNMFFRISNANYVKVAIRKSILKDQSDNKYCTSLYQLIFEYCFLVFV